MKLDNTINLYAGGEGSGCNEETAEAHGTSCGPKKSKEQKEIEKAAKQKEAFEKYQQGLLGEKKLLGIWRNTSGEAILYKAMMSGDWHKISELKTLLGDKKTSVTSYLKWVGNAGRRLDQWKVEISKSSGEARLIQKNFGNAAKGQVEITSQQQHAALTA